MSGSRAGADIEVRPLTDAIGAEVLGVDLGKGVDDATFEAIHQAYLDHLVLVFPDQDLSPEAQIAFTERFGRVEPHPLRARAGHPEYGNLLVLENSAQRRGARNNFWHSDISCMAEPPSAAFLFALAVPEGKGDTMFCNMVRAFETLPEHRKQMLLTMTAEHSGEAILARNREAATDGNTEMTIPPPQIHPVVRRHPETGRPALYVNRFFTTGFTGMTPEDSRALLQELETHATRDDNVYRHRWRAGDAVLWDNRCTMHFAHYDYEPTDHRRMHRTTANGDRPVAA